MPALSRLRDAREKDPSSTMLGHYVTLPVYIAPAAMAKLGHPLGEVNLTRGAGECGIVQGVSSLEFGSQGIDCRWKTMLSA
jgi:L-lactate dehydrogenase (cytochrome)